MVYVPLLLLLLLMLMLMLLLIYAQRDVVTLFSRVDVRHERMKTMS
jgi:hypothetical protein